MVALCGVYAPSVVAGNVCGMSLLRELGWQVTDAAIAQPLIAGGTPCQRASLDDAHAHRDLQLQVPQHFDPVQREQLAVDVLQQQASVCAYLFKLGDATRAATTRLQENRGYRFSAVQMGWIGFGLGGAKAQGWQRFRSFGRGYAPVATNSSAVDAFYRGNVRSECGVGRQIAQLATQREMYGDALFDREFAPGELSIGTFLTLHKTQSILLGSSAGEFFADGKAVRTSAMGRQAFMGAPGFIAHVFDKKYLDDINNQAENFVITDLSDAAAQALARHGGFAHYDAVNRQIWELSQQMPGSGWRRFERLLYERDTALRAALPPEHQQVLARIDTLLADPVYRELMLYVHPKGVRPLGYHIARLLDRNPRTPFSIDLALHNLHTTLYRRWVDARLRACGNTMSGTTNGDETWNWA
ncbi:hypothetical protein [Stenotrophomonas sp. Iso1]|uniref:hypothetical protein n=1 Tax=Stenotrophomonas sp. Iso1 TaxID=2977283 RepID=UPI0022B7A717|nr:hypothetical protein [Stenotrophomonas sp. Iso1]